MCFEDLVLELKKKINKDIDLTPGVSQTIQMFNLGHIIIKKCTNIYISEHINVKGCLKKSHFSNFIFPYSLCGILILF